MTQAAYTGEDLALLAALRAIDEANRHQWRVILPEGLADSLIERQWVALTRRLTRLGRRELRAYVESIKP